MENFNLQPILAGDLLYLRPLMSEDFESLYSVSSDPLIWEQHPEQMRYQRDIFHRFFLAAMESKGAFVAIDSKSNEIIGSSRYCGLDISQNQVEIGYTFLARKCWGKGYNGEMKKLMLAHAFQYVARAVFLIGEHNFRSRRAIEKIGASLIGKIERIPTEGAKYNALKYVVEKK
jgi:RimJ/RimL family protein N-acetyltransferase